VGVCHTTISLENNDWINMQKNDFFFVFKRPWTDQAKAKTTRYKEAAKVNRG